MTLPSADAQANLIEETYRRAGLEFGTTSYVEAHVCGAELCFLCLLIDVEYRAQVHKQEMRLKWKHLAGLSLRSVLLNKL